VLAKHAVSFATLQTGGRRQDRGEEGCGTPGVRGRVRFGSLETLERFRRTSASPSEADISGAGISA